MCLGEYGNVQQPLFSLRAPKTFIQYRFEEIPSHFITLESWTMRVAISYFTPLPSKTSLEVNSNVGTFNAARAFVSFQTKKSKTPK